MEQNRYAFYFTRILKSSLLVGGLSCEVLLAQDAYVPNEGDNSISVINLSEQTVTHTVSVGTHPHFASFTPDNAFVYVSNSDSSTVSVIDASTYTVMNTIALPGSAHPNTMSFSSDGATVYVADDANPCVYVIDTASGTVVQTVTLESSSAACPAVSVVGDLLYVALNDFNSGVSSIVVLETSQYTTQATIPLSGSTATVRDMNLSPNGKVVYVVDQAAGTVYVIDTTTHMVANAIMGIPSAQTVTFTPDGRFAYVSSQGGLAVSSVYVIDTSSETVTHTVMLGKGPDSVAFTPDGLHAYVPNLFDNTVSIIDTQTYTVTGSVNVGLHPYFIATPFPPPPLPTPPRFLSGQQYKSDCGEETFNFLQWDPSLATQITYYVVYRDGVCLSTIPSSFVEHVDHITDKGVMHVYNVTAINSNELESDPISIAIR